MREEKQMEANMQDIQMEPLQIEDEMKKKHRKGILWLLLILFLLILGIGLTVAILGNRLGEKAGTDDDVITLLPEDGDEVKDGDLDASDAAADSDVSSAEEQSNPVNVNGTRKLQTLHAEMITEDSKRVWSTMTRVDIFDDFYTGTYKAGTHDEVTVESDDGANVIAPGTDGYYTFWIKNTGEVPMDYQLSFESKQNYDYGIPMEFRLKSGDMYIFGDGANWKSWEELNKAGEGKRLNPRNYARYTLEWRWKFRGDNEHDTYLGNKAVHQDVRQDVIIYTTGKVSAGYEGAYQLLSVQTGDTTNIWLYVILVLAAVGGILFFLYVRRKDEEDEE